MLRLQPCPERPPKCRISGSLAPPSHRIFQHSCGFRVRLVFLIAQVRSRRQAPSRGRCVLDRRQGKILARGAVRAASSARRRRRNPKLHTQSGACQGHDEVLAGEALALGQRAEPNRTSLADGRNGFNENAVRKRGRFLCVRMRQPGALLRQAPGNGARVRDEKRAHGTCGLVAVIPRYPGPRRRQGFFNHPSGSLPDGGKGSAPPGSRQRSCAAGPPFRGGRDRRHARRAAAKRHRWCGRLVSRQRPAERPRSADGGAVFRPRHGGSHEQCSWDR
jgi:hypothetical protein